MEKYENYININNLGKSKNIYSTNSFSAKNEIFWENFDKGKEGKKLLK